MEESRIQRVASLVGIGLLAGFAGAVLMTVSQKVEMAITGRQPSSTPAEAAEKIAGVDLADTDEQRLSTPLHLAFGSALGLGLAASARVPEPARSALFFAGAWSAGTGVLTGLELSEPPTRWDAKTLAVDLAHHAVYAAGAVAAFVGLRRALRQ